jgi:signal transduction histidine kinase
MFKQSRRKIVAPLEESYQKQKQFISDAGHELKTPISVVSANAELLSREIGDNQWLQNIQYENQRMGLLVGQLLELARTENAAPMMKQIDLSRLIAGEALPFESVAFEQGLVLHTDVAPEIFMKGSSHQLKQLTAILLDNALRHSQGGTDVRLTLRKEHGYAVLSVINPGAEIPECRRQQIFERFYRMDPARNGEDKHYGLGLSIAKAIVTVHQGHIEVLCRNGLVEFRIQLPVL